MAHHCTPLKHNIYRMIQNSLTVINKQIGKMIRTKKYLGASVIRATLIYKKALEVARTARQAEAMKKRILGYERKDLCIATGIEN